jgi:hypothetical protein
MTKAEITRWREEKRARKQRAGAGMALTGLGMPSARDPPTIAGVPMMTTEENIFKPPLWVQAPTPPPSARPSGPCVFERQDDGRWVRQPRRHTARAVPGSTMFGSTTADVAYYKAAKQRAELGRKQERLWSEEHEAAVKEMRELKQEERFEARHLAADRRANTLTVREASALRREQRDQMNSGRRMESGRDWVELQAASKRLQELELMQKTERVVRPIMLPLLPLLLTDSACAVVCDCGQRDVSMTLRTAGSTATAHTRRAVLYTDAKDKSLVLPPVFSPKAISVVWDGPAAPPPRRGLG